MIMMMIMMMMIMTYTEQIWEQYAKHNNMLSTTIC